jgi:hypothetical protein
MTALFGWCLDGLCDQCRGTTTTPNADLTCSHDCHDVGVDETRGDNAAEWEADLRNEYEVTR